MDDDDAIEGPPHVQLDALDPPGERLTETGQSIFRVLAGGATVGDDLHGATTYRTRPGEGKGFGC